MTLLEVKNLSVGYRTREGIFPAVRDAGFSLNRGKSLGIIGESGCGKTTIGMTILRLLPENAEVLSGSILFNGTDLTALPDRRMREIRGAKISMIFQAAMNSLNPVRRVGDQIVEALLTHNSFMTDQQAAARVEALFDEVGLSGERMADFPHQYSGGMKQRAIIAMALACSPELIIADEPTTALDMVVQSRILSRIKAVQQEKGIAVILISHDIGVISEICHDVAVVFKGEVIEYGKCSEILNSPRHPYTCRLISSCIKLSRGAVLPDFREEDRMGPAGPSAGNACVYRDNCADADKVCRDSSPGFKRVSESHTVRCHLVSD
ncbi:MAG: ABC transporter ATP-binding protein [Desulfobacteraceae bacterium]